MSAEELEFISSLETQMQRALVDNSPEALDACKVLCKQYNTLAMQILEQGDFQLSLEFLQKAEVLLDAAGPLSDDPRRLRLLSATLNNLGCYFKKAGDFEQALYYLNACISLEEGHTGVENPAGTLLNLCVVLGSLGRHSEALSFAVDSVLLSEEKMGLKWPPPDRSAPPLVWDKQSVRALESLAKPVSSSSTKPTAEDDSPSRSIHPIPEDENEGRLTARESEGNDENDARSENKETSTSQRESAQIKAQEGEREGEQLTYMLPSALSTLAVAYHNLAAECEYLGFSGRALDGYRRACLIAQVYFGRGSPMHKRFESTLRDFRDKLNRQAAASKRPSSAPVNSIKGVTGLPLPKFPVNEKNEKKIKELKTAYNVYTSSIGFPTFSDTLGYSSALSPSKSKQERMALARSRPHTASAAPSARTRSSNAQSPGQKRPASVQIPKRPFTSGDAEGNQRQNQIQKPPVRPGNGREWPASSSSAQRGGSREGETAPTAPIQRPEEPRSPLMRPPSAPGRSSSSSSLRPTHSDLPAADTTLNQTVSYSTDFEHYSEDFESFGATGGSGGGQEEGEFKGMSLESYFGIQRPLQTIPEGSNSGSPSRRSEFERL